ncbi:hypothetical protein [Gordonia phthalatica]|uniref:Uncharacterized protein n=1 Tax=Gordonia phthalatica TaxID=1136941 RepID=A0A0N9N0P3_9ACTN|nr:hypothetical protein [Gordonia phthalatica]ALG84161.1 hypothetical protein ACH46_06135 [Gordonia phthalatica]
MDEMTSCADGFVALITACRELGLTGVDDTTVRGPHRRVDEFRHADFAADARRLTALVRRLAGVSVVGAVSSEPGESVADWTGRSGRSAGGALRVVGAELADLFTRLDDGAAATARADAVLGGVLRRHRAVLATVSKPMLGGFDLEALPAALNSGALHPNSLRGEVQARLDYAEAAGQLAGEAIVGAVEQVATAWAAYAGSDGDLALADLR